MPTDRVSDYPEALRREAAKNKRRLEVAEVEVERVKAEAAERVAELTARVAAERERALAAEAKLDDLARHP